MPFVTLLLLIAATVVTVRRRPPLRVSRMQQEMQQEARCVEASPGRSIPEPREPV